jgi:hypothetical protein
MYIYTHGGYGHLHRGVVDKTVDTFHPLTVDWLLGRLVNTLGNKVIGAVVRR